MKHLRLLIATATLGALAAFTVAVRAQVKAPDQAEVALRAAMEKESVAGELKAAIEEYRKIATTYAKSNRAIAARALLRMGQCHEKLGNDEARKAYERLVMEFADQAEPARVARERLAALAKAAQSSQPSAIAIRQVWTAVNMLVAFGDITPDHRYLTFVDFLTGDLAVRDLVNGTSRRLTNKGSWDVSDEFAEFSVISADGTQVAYNWLNHPQGKKPAYSLYDDEIWDLRVAGLEGSGARVVTRWGRGTYVRPLCWSPDGKRILVGLNGVTEGRESFRLVFVSVADGSVEEVKAAPTPTGYDSPRDTRISFRLSPDGRYILYARPPEKDVAQQDIFLTSVQDGQESLLIQHPANDSAPLWTPDGKKVLFASNRTGALAFWAVDVVEGKAQGSPQLVKANIGMLLRAIGFAKDGSLYYGLAAEPQDVHIADVDPVTGKLSGQPKSIGRIVGSNRTPSWSRDGQFLAYHGRGGVNSRTIVVRSVKNGQEREISTKLLLERFAPMRWFPDGQSLLVSAYRDRDGSGVDYYRIDLRTGEPSLLRRGTTRARIAPSLSPDSKLIFLIQSKGENGEPTRFIAYNIETGQEKEIHRHTLGVRFLAVSPDGRELAFVDSDDGAGVTSVKVMPVDGEQPRELLKALRPERIQAGFPVEWTPNGKYVLVAKTRDARGVPMNEVLRVPVDGGEAQPIGLARRGMWSVSVHPDGRQIAFDSQESRAEVWAMENFLSSLSAPK